MNGPVSSPTAASLSSAVPAGPVRPPAPARPSHTGKAAARPDDPGLRVLTYLRLHWLMILFCGSLLGGCAAYAAWHLLASKYESYALLQVSSVPATIANINNREQARTDFITYLKTTAALIKSEFVLNAALREIKDLPTIKAQKDPLKFLDEELMVSWQDGSEVIRIACKTTEPADAKRIVDAVQAAFLKEVVQKDRLERQAFHKQIEDALVEMRNVLKRKAEGERALARSPVEPAAAPAGDVPAVMPAAPTPLPPLAPAADPAGPAPPAPVVPATAWETVARLNPQVLVNRVTNLMAEAERLPLSINDGKRRLAVLQQKMEAVKNAPVSQATRDAVEKDPDVIAQVLKTKQARREYEFHRNAGDPNAPGVRDLYEAWQAHEARLARLRQEKAEVIETARRVAEANKIAAEMEDLIRSLQRQQEQLELVRKELAAAEKQLALVPPPSEKPAAHVPADPKEPGYRPELSDLAQTDSVYAGLVRQFYLVQMELNSPPRVRALQPGSTPTQKEVKKQLLGTVFAGLMGFGLMGLGAVAYETLTKRVSSLADVRAGGLPVVGVVPHAPAAGVGADPARRAAATEAVDKLRAHVTQAWLARGAATVAVTSSLGDEGKAFAAFGLASSLAHSGYKTLLVDCDLRDPRLHELAGTANDVGVCELLRGETDPHSAVQFLPSGLHLLPAGKWSDEARKAATGERFESLLARLRTPYDCVVLHAHALLTAAEAVEVVRRCEVVLVCALYRETTIPLLKRAAERLAAMEIPYCGVVYLGASEREALY